MLTLPEADLQNTCFVCGFQKKDFERVDLSFSFHRNFEHYVWNYVYYIVYLLNKNPTEFSGVEFYIFLKYQRNSLDWLPIGKARSLGKLARVTQSPQRETTTR